MWAENPDIERNSGSGQGGREEGQGECSQAAACLGAKRTCQISCAKAPSAFVCSLPYACYRCSLPRSVQPSNNAEGPAHPLEQANAGVQAGLARTGQPEVINRCEYTAAASSACCWPASDITPASALHTGAVAAVCLLSLLSQAGGWKDRRAWRGKQGC